MKDIASFSIERERSLHNMEEDFKIIDNYLMIRMPTEIDHHKSVDISKRADRYIMSKKVGNVVFDFERTTFMDSSGVGVILGRYRKISCFGGRCTRSMRAAGSAGCFCCRGWRILSS